MPINKQKRSEEQRKPRRKQALLTMTGNTIKTTGGDNDDDDNGEGKWTKFDNSTFRDRRRQQQNKRDVMDDLELNLNDVDIGGGGRVDRDNNHPSNGVGPSVGAEWISGWASNTTAETGREGDPEIDVIHQGLDTANGGENGVDETVGTTVSSTEGTGHDEQSLPIAAVLVGDENSQRRMDSELILQAARERVLEEAVVASAIKIDSKGPQRRRRRLWIIIIVVSICVLALTGTSVGIVLSNQSSSDEPDPVPFDAFLESLAEKNSITSLVLRNFGLTGTIPTIIGAMTKLTFIDLRDNRLTGQIPTEIGKLTDLEAIELSRNELIGQIPTEIGQLTALELLRITTNDLSGTIPPTEYLVELVELQTLNLAVNSIGGDIPDDLFSNLPVLEELTLRSNKLIGTLPTELGLAVSLTKLNVLDNQLTGIIPTELLSLTNLVELDLGQNMFVDGANELCPIFESRSWVDPYIYGTDCYTFNGDHPQELRCDCCTKCYNDMTGTACRYAPAASLEECSGNDAFGNTTADLTNALPSVTSATSTSQGKIGN